MFGSIQTSRKQSVLFIIMFALAGCLIFMTGCAKNFQQARYELPEAETKILVAGISSDYRDAIKDRLIERYKTRSNIEVVGLNQLKEIQCDDYDAVLVMDQCKGWSLYNLALKSFLEKSAHCDNIVVFITAGDPDWEYHYNGLDAVTSASYIGYEDRVYKELASRIDGILTPQN